MMLYKEGTVVYREKVGWRVSICNGGYFMPYTLHGAQKLSQHTIGNILEDGGIHRFDQYYLLPEEEKSGALL